MRTIMSIVEAVALAVILTSGSWFAPLTPVVVGQHGQEHGGDPGTPRNAIRAEEAPGVVSLESLRFT